MPRDYPAQHPVDTQLTAARIHRFLRFLRGQVRASVAQKELAAYVAWNREFGSFAEDEEKAESANTSAS